MECPKNRFIEGEPRTQSLLFPERLDDWIADDNPVRVIDAFVDELDLKELGFEGAVPAETGRPAYHPSTLLKIYLYGYLNRFVTSTVAPVASGGSISPGGTLTHWKAPPFHGAPQWQSFRSLQVFHVMLKVQRLWWDSQITKSKPIVVASNEALVTS